LRREQAGPRGCVGMRKQVAQASRSRRGRPASH
jgi:hypothetical protein